MLLSRPESVLRRIWILWRPRMDLLCHRAGTEYLGTWIQSTRFAFRLPWLRDPALLPSEVGVNQYL